MKNKRCSSYKEMRFAKRNNQLIIQQRMVKVYDQNPWYNPFGLNYSFEYSAWEDMPITDAEKQ